MIVSVHACSSEASSSRLFLSLWRRIQKGPLSPPSARSASSAAARSAGSRPHRPMAVALACQVRLASSADVFLCAEGHTTQRHKSTTPFDEATPFFTQFRVQKSTQVALLFSINMMTICALLAVVVVAGADGTFTPWRSLPANRKVEYTFGHFEQEFQRVWGE